MKKIELVMDYSWGFRSLSFIKTFEIPCHPFIGLSILDENDDSELMIDIKNDDYQKSSIIWRVSTQIFEVDIRTNWGKYGISKENIEDLIKTFELLGWKKLHTDKEEEEMLSWSEKNEK